MPNVIVDLKKRRNKGARVTEEIPTPMDERRKCIKP